MTESTLLNYTTADFSTKADMEIRIYRWQEQRDKYLPKLQAKGMLGSQLPEFGTRKAYTESDICSNIRTNKHIKIVRRYGKKLKVI